MLQPGEDADTIGFHDLAHEYLLLHADALPMLHEQLLDAYRVLLAEPDQWWTLPAHEPYIWEHLAAHLAHAGDHKPLVATVTDPAYQARRITRDGPHAGEADLTVAVRVVPDHPVVGWWRVWLARYGHLLMTGAATDGSRVAATMSTWLEADPTRPPSVRPGRLVPLLSRPYLAVHGGLTAAPGALVRVLTGHRYGVFALAWSPDGSRLMTGGGADQQVRLWDAATGATIVTLTGHTDWVHAVAWSSDGTSLASADNGGDRPPVERRPAPRPPPTTPAPRSTPCPGRPTAATWQAATPTPRCTCGTSPPAPIRPSAPATSTG